MPPDCEDLDPATRRLACRAYWASVWQSRGSVGDAGLHGQPLPEPGDPWDWRTSPVQLFALSVGDGYALYQRSRERLDALLGDTNPGAFPDEAACAQLTLPEARVVLFMLQRSFRDSRGEPDPAVVARLIGRIRELAAGG